MKVIDLLNKIARFNDGYTEDIPNEIKCRDIIYWYDETDDDETARYKDIHGDLLIEDCYLNDEIEIIEIKEEEKKIPEKLPTWYSVEKIGKVEDNIEYENYNFETMYEKINEIIDYLKSKGEE